MVSITYVVVAVVARINTCKPLAAQQLVYSKYYVRISFHHKERHIFIVAEKIYFQMKNFKYIVSEKNCTSSLTGAYLI